MPHNQLRSGLCSFSPPLGSPSCIREVMLFTLKTKGLEGLNVIYHFSLLTRRYTQTQPGLSISSDQSLPPSRQALPLLPRITEQQYLVGVIFLSLPCRYKKSRTLDGVDTRLSIEARYPLARGTFRSIYIQLELLSSYCSSFTQLLDPCEDLVFSVDHDIFREVIFLHPRFSTHSFGFSLVQLALTGG